MMFESAPKQALSPTVSLQWLNESAVLLEVGEVSSDMSLLDKNKQVQAWMTAIEQNRPVWLIDCVAAYTGLLLEFDPLLIDHYGLSHFLRDVKVSSQNTNTQTTYRIPVCYEPLGPSLPNDMLSIKSHSGLNEETIIELHSKQAYRVYAVGFMPNFAYLGELNKSLQTPRLEEPRIKVPAGAVAIADNQTAIYPGQSPGGWHIIGYTPLVLLNNTEFTFAVGDEIVFEPISVDVFLQQAEENS